MSWILVQECKETRMYGKFIKAVVVQVILLFGSDVWFVTTGLGRTLGGLRNMVALRMTKNPCRRPNSSWYYPPIGEDM